jgi:hypothetical protein
LRCLKHEVGDLDPIPGNVLKGIRDFAESKFIPALLDYFESLDPEYGEYSVEDVEEEGFYIPFNVKSRITKEMAYDIDNGQDILFGTPEVGNRKIDGKREIGCVIRIYKAIKRQDLADEIHKIVKGCFVPDENQDPKDSKRFVFGLDVEPSTGKVQCNCCKEK